MAGESEGDDAVLHRSGAHHYSPIAGELAKLSWTHHQHHDASASEPSGEVGPEEADEEAARLRLEAVDRRNAKYLSRAFFVQMVAQREIEVSEDKWQEVLQRQARLLTPVGSLVGTLIIRGCTMKRVAAEASGALAQATRGGSENSIPMRR